STSTTPVPRSNCIGSWSARSPYRLRQSLADEHGAAPVRRRVGRRGRPEPSLVSACVASDTGLLCNEPRPERRSTSFTLLIHVALTGPTETRLQPVVRRQRREPRRQRAGDPTRIRTTAARRLSYATRAG